MTSALEGTLAVRGPQRFAGDRVSVRGRLAEGRPSAVLLAQSTHCSELLLYLKPDKDSESTALCFYSWRDFYVRKESARDSLTGVVIA